MSHLAQEREPPRCLPLSNLIGMCWGNILGSCWLSGGKCHHGAYQGRRDPFQIVGALKYRDVSSQKPFADTTKQAQEIAAAGPNAFHGVGMDFPNAITIRIACPLAAWRGVANRLVTTATRGQVLIGRPFIGGDDRVGARMSDHQPFQRGPISPFTDPQPNVATVAPNNPHNRWAVAGPGPMAARLVSPPAWWVAWVSMLTPFLFGVLIQFVGFGEWVGEWRGRGKNAPPPADGSRVVVRVGGCD
jgi:hypothetical protein